MIKPPYTKWINDIKTKLGFNRTMTASGADVVDAVNKQAQQIDYLGPLNVLTSDSTTAALSAAQGKALLNIINNLNDGFTYVSTNSITLDMDSNKVYFVFTAGGSAEGMSNPTYGFMAILLGTRTYGILHKGTNITYNYTRDTFTLTAGTTLIMGVIVLGKVNQK